MIMWLLKGLKLTAKRFVSKKITQLYPEVYPNLPEETRGSFVFEAEKCTSCNLCAMACPNKVISVNTTKDENGKRCLADYQMSISYCLYCGLCEEACPTSAIKMVSKFNHSFYQKESSLKSWKGKKA